MAEWRSLATQLKRQASVGALGELAVGKQPQTLLEAQGAGLGQCALLGELTGHGRQFELLQLLDSWMT